MSGDNQDSGTETVEVVDERITERIVEVGDDGDDMEVSGMEEKGAESGSEGATVLHPQSLPAATTSGTLDSATLEAADPQEMEVDRMEQLSVDGSLKTLPQRSRPLPLDSTQEEGKIAVESSSSRQAGASTWANEVGEDEKPLWGGEVGRTTEAGDSEMQAWHPASHREE